MGIMKGQKASHQEDTQVWMSKGLHSPLLLEAEKVKTLHKDA